MSRLAREDTQEFQLTQYLSNEEGQSNLALAREQFAQAIASYRSDRPLPIKLRMYAGTSRFGGNDIFGQLVVAALDRALPPQLTKFSYFPADRAFPQGEIAI